MTLIEIMIVVIIMALIATAVGVAVLPQLEKARIKSTRTDAQSIRSAVTLYLADHPGDSCPNIDDLVEDAALDSSKRTTDAWERDFQIDCDNGGINVLSAGPDGQFGSEDDVQ
ncbi:MAG: type II secretion system protein GspG [Deltaproteobacteria bacterium]|nr:type II secretion system protein GspG [Deltaproteobacteria bacterium]